MASRREYDEKIASLEEERRLVREIRELKERRAVTSLGGLPTGPADHTGLIDLTDVEEDVKDPGLSNHKRKLEEFETDVERAMEVPTEAIPHQQPGQEYTANVAKRPKNNGLMRRGHGKSRFASVNDDPAYAPVVKLADGKYAELHCCFCKGNASANAPTNKSKLFRGGFGLQTHITLSHHNRIDGTFTHQMVMERCVKRKLTKKETRAVNEGDHETYKVIIVPASRLSRRSPKVAEQRKGAESGSTIQASDARDSGQQGQFSTSSTCPGDQGPEPRAENAIPGGTGMCDRVEELAQALKRPQCD